MNELYRILTFRENGDERGNLVVVEGNDDIPFDIKRVFYMYGTDSTQVRGKHANRNSQFVLINVSGSSDIYVSDGMGHDATIHLDKPRMGVFIPRMVWKEMKNFSSDSVMLCLTDTHYDAGEYIRDWDAYLQEIGQSEKAETENTR